MRLLGSYIAEAIVLATVVAGAVAVVFLLWGIRP